MNSNKINSKNTKPLSMQGYPGTRDFYPENMRLQNWLNSHIEQVMQRFGYEEYAGPILEPLELYASKSSEEIVSQQLYSFVDRGERTVAIRPEMTPTLARMVAAKYKETLKPIRWFSIPTCMRYERPQRGRLREFEQLNVDVFGGNTLDEDIEIILIIIDLMQTLGAKPEDYEIKINHRGLVNDILNNVLQIPVEQIAPAMRLLDKIEKLKPEEIENECIKLGINKDKFAIIQNMFQTDISGIAKVLGSENPNVQAMQERLNIFSALGVQNSIKFSPAILRGFDYYTGMVFEVFDNSESNRRALFGGGRYDNLLSAFGVEPLPGIGFGTSDVSLINFCEVHNLLPELTRNVDVSVIRFTENDRLSALELAQCLRSAGLCVLSPITMSKFGKQIQSAEKAGAKAVVFRGEEEIKNNCFAVKWLKTGEQISYQNNIEGYLQLKADINKI